ncbi:hypothetical protein Cni_G28853 [Canna indica]|uniref:Uncharacterized protein n=1 Tax=Canna indica TaxID=4628 RepID=A0AAQ3L830_9LILI|nr:hypothetical protein Cni_G28853 [Canna indica]
MERGEPALVPQWYRLANGSTPSHAVRTSSSKHSDENGVGIGSKNRSVGDQDRNLRRSLSSNGSLNRDKGSSGKSQAYSSFRRSRDRNQDKDFDSRDRENRSVLIDNGFDHRDPFPGIRAEKDALRKSQSMTAGRQMDSWPKRVGSNANNGSPNGGSIIGSIGKTSFEKDFPSLRAEGRQSFSDGGGVSPLGVRTAVQSLPITSPVIIGTSALAEVPVRVETGGTILSPVIQAASISQPSASGSTMAEALAQAPPQVANSHQSSVDNQRIEELALKKCKQLIPVTPSIPKALGSKGARSGDYSSLTKIGQQTHTNLTVRPPARSDVTKTSIVGNFQVLNREKNGTSPTARDGPIVGKINPTGSVPSATAGPLKSPTDLRFKVDNKNGTSIQNTFGERKGLSQAQNRNDFFNLLRKKSSTSSSTIQEPSSVEPTTRLEMSDAENTEITSPTNMANNSPASVSALNYSMENGNCLNEGSCASNESESFFADNGDTNPHSDIAVDPEEEAFLQSLGWDKNAGEEALTKEEIDAFLKKYENRRPLKVMPADLNESSLPGSDE